MPARFPNSSFFFLPFTQRTDCGPLTTGLRDYADKWSGPDYTGDVSASEIINELPKLTEAERQAVLDKLRELAQVDDDRWEQIINEPMPRPKLKAFIERATAEGSVPLDLNRM